MIRNIKSIHRKLRRLKLLARQACEVVIDSLGPSRFELKAQADIKSDLHNGFISHDEGSPLDSFVRDELLATKLIAFYLPQFHAIPENDEWWGKGFTEWTNVKPAKPLFDGHYQPHIPLSLGYYDLLDKTVLTQQTKLAKEYGIYGFCFYFYWFDGKTLLEKPLQMFLQDQELEFPFCLCWANENWSRRWDGKSNEILISQHHREDDDIAFIRHISDYLQDSRYIRVHGKPLLIVYRPSLLPDPASTVQRWRNWALANGIGDLFIAYTQSFENVPPKHYGFDAAIEFPPNNSPVDDITTSVSGLIKDFSGHIFDFSFFRRRAAAYASDSQRSFIWRAVCPSWDNTARRKSSATIFVGSNPDGFFHWLRYAIYDTLSRHPLPNERLVFINAWNEWAEGAHLEPDQRYGFAWLEACRRALNSVGRELALRRKIVLLMHDCHPHGAQYLALSLCKSLLRSGYEVQLLALDGGLLLSDFESLASLQVLAGLTAVERSLTFQRIQKQGFNYIIANTTVCGSILHEISLREFRIVTLVHELPEFIRKRNFEASVESVVRFSDKVIFPAELVAEGYRQFCELPHHKSIIRHQGLVRQNPFKGRRDEARELITERYQIPADAIIILSIAFLEDRKGPDLLIESLRHVRNSSDIQMHCIWVGHHDKDVLERIDELLDKYSLKSFFHLAGFVRDPFEFYVAADIYALPSREDPFPNVVLESANVGLPVVAFKGMTGCDDLIAASGGILVQPLSCLEYAESLLRLSCSNRSIGSYVSTNSLALSMHAYAQDICYELLSMPRVSVIVPNYNYAHYLSERLKGIAYQKLTPYEIIVLDDCSTDASAEVIKAFGGECDIPYRSLIQAENSGSPFRQWRQGVEEASGDLIWIAEADDLCDPLFLSELVPLFSDPDVVIAYCESRQISGDGTILAESYAQWTSNLGTFWDRSYCVEGLCEIERALSVKNTIPNASAVLFKRDQLQKAMSSIQHDLERLIVAGDWCLYLELLRYGKIAYSAQSLNSHRRHSHSVTTTSNRERHFEEVKEMQKRALDIIRQTQPSPCDLDHLQRRADQYLAVLATQFAAAS